ncbi:MAG: hypothetical protein R2712_28165 [Vicinamibacterales bacterium]
MTTPPPAAPRPASTVVVLRAAGTAYEVLLVRRNDRVAFMAGAFVFPGGRVDDDDRGATPDARFLGEPRASATSPRRRNSRIAWPASGSSTRRRACVSAWTT